MSENISPSSEYELITRLHAVLQMESGKYYPVGIGDDAAVRRADAGNRLVLTTDVSVEDIHFSRAYMSMEEIGYRAMVSNLSDCAAMGGRPDGALVQLVIPRKEPDAIPAVEALYHGFREAGHRWRFPVVGGDISSGVQWVIGITLLGRVPVERRILLRKGMKPGDRLWITGPPGRSAAGLLLLQQMRRSEIPDEYTALVTAHIRPVPRVEYGEFLGMQSEVHSVMDCSDGLSKDCRTLCRENGCGIILTADTSHLPDAMIQLSREIRHPWQQWYFHGGEDYELLFSADSGFDPAECELFSGESVPVCIGECTDKVSGLFVREGTAVVALAEKSFDHIGIHLK